MAGIRRGGDCGRNYYRLHNHAGETPAFSGLQSAFGGGQAFAAGATTAIINRLHNHAGDARKGERSAAWQSPKALCSAKSAGVLACETPVGGNHQRLHNRRRRGRLLSMLAPRGRLWQKLPPLAQPTQATPGRENAAQPGEQASSPAKRQSVVITTAYTTDAGEVACFPGIRSVHPSSGDAGEDACVLCFAERLRRWPG